jgi:hypothetical protein
VFARRARVCGVQRVYEIRSFIWWGFGTRSERHSPSWTKQIVDAKHYQNVKMVSESVIVLYSETFIELYVIAQHFHSGYSHDMAHSLTLRTVSRMGF